MQIDGNSSINAHETGFDTGGNRGANSSSATQADRASWFEAMSRAWGEGLDQQAGEVTQLSQEMRNGTGGSDGLGNQVDLQAEVQRMSFLSQSASNSVKSAGQALSSLARKG